MARRSMGMDTSGSIDRTEKAVYRLLDFVQIHGRKIGVGAVMLGVLAGGGAIKSCDNNREIGNPKVAPAEQIEHVPYCFIDPQAKIREVDLLENGNVAASLIHKVAASGETPASIASCYFDRSLGSIGVKSIQASNWMIAGFGELDTIDGGIEIVIQITADKFTSAKDRTVQEVAEISGFDVSIIAELNGVDSDAIFEAGTEILLPLQRGVIPGETAHVVSPGDTYWNIAGGDKEVVKLMEKTNGFNPNQLKPGIVLFKSNAQRGNNNGEDAPAQGSETGTDQTPEKTADQLLEEFVNEYKPLANKVEKTYGVPTDLALAQAILESNYGRSELAKEAHNYHGLKANNGWTGEIYTKPTKEVDENGNEIEVIAKFRVYNDASAGFMGYGDKLKNEHNYDDAFGETDPVSFLERMVDTNGPKYASDPEYMTKARIIIKRIQDLEMSSSPSPEGSSEDEVDPVIKEKIEAVKLTPEGYKEFVENINMDYVVKSPSSTYPHNTANGTKVEQGTTEYLIWHFTAVDGYTDPNHLLNGLEPKNCGIQFFIDRFGRIYQLTEDPNTKVAHVYGMNKNAVGVEIEAKDQVGVSTEQYEQAAYWAAWMLINQNLLDGKSEKDLADIVGGHNDLVTRKGFNNDHHSDFSEVESEMVRKKLVELLKAMGYISN